MLIVMPCCGQKSDTRVLDEDTALHANHCPGPARPVAQGLPPSPEALRIGRIEPMLEDEWATKWRRERRREKYAQNN